MTRSPPEEAQLHPPARLPACPPQLGFLTFLEIVFLPNCLNCISAKSYLLCRCILRRDLKPAWESG